LEKSDQNVNNRDVNNCPTGRWWPPPLLVGLILCAGSLLLTYYGAERFENLGLEGRLYHLWWVPFIYVTLIVGCRLMALDCWWF
jgi:hypothetical protein